MPENTEIPILVRIHQVLQWCVDNERGSSIRIKDDTFQVVWTDTPVKKCATLTRKILVYETHNVRLTTSPNTRHMELDPTARYTWCYNIGGDGDIQWIYKVFSEDIENVRQVTAYNLLGDRGNQIIHVVNINRHTGMLVG